jgi:hypothetical protein
VRSRERAARRLAVSRQRPSNAATDAAPSDGRFPTLYAQDDSPFDDEGRLDGEGCLPPSTRPTWGGGVVLVAVGTGCPVAVGTGEETDVVPPAPLPGGVEASGAPASASAQPGAV